MSHGFRAYPLARPGVPIAISTGIYVGKCPVMTFDNEINCFKSFINVTLHRCLGLIGSRIKLLFINVSLNPIGLMHWYAFSLFSFTINKITNSKHSLPMCVKTNKQKMKLRNVLLFQNKQSQRSYRSSYKLLSEILFHHN